MTTPRVLVIACGALARELLAVNELNRLETVTIECLPAALHNRPDEIPELVRARIHRARGAQVAAAARTSAPGDAELVDTDVRLGAPTSPTDGTYDEILVGYADCGTGGRLAAVCTEEGVEMLPGAHCYEFFATTPAFERLHEEAIGTFYLTDFLARNFERLIWQGLGIARHPELRDMYFGNYTRVVYLAQTDDPVALAAAHDAADRLALELHVERTGYGDLATTVVAVAGRS